MKTDDQEQRLLEALRAVLEEFGNYGEPRVRGDGDIQIPLDIELKKARARQSNLADAFSRCLLYTSPSPRDGLLSRMPSSA